MDWQQFYEKRLSTLETSDHLRQVGHTVLGQPISEAHFQLLLEQITETLGLAQDDALLDVCCGNGLFTAKLADRVARARGVDLSPTLVSVARRDHSRANLAYLEGDARQLEHLRDALEPPFNKILLYAALQHFTLDEFDRVLRQMLSLATPKCVIFLGFVPDKARRGVFYNTPLRRTSYLWRRLRGADAMGVWWTKRTLTDACRRHNVSCSFVPLPDGMHAARYRFNVLINRGA